MQPKAAKIYHRRRNDGSGGMMRACFVGGRGFDFGGSLKGRESLKGTFGPTLLNFGERDTPKYFRSRSERDLEASPAGRSATNRLSSTNCIEFHFSFVWIRHSDTTKKTSSVTERDTP